ncbi:ankyrin repeat-containing domain protein [Triangularia setosa]|uniref:Ankyrin repeat-containing domain protein n=1 Tax=Triangularia setosa TaxID=2587417 RepID=A0AAN7A6N8_9PEZI|nr:ankyrin repeat-containing domain protein [Podospora setosa]
MASDLRDNEENSRADLVEVHEGNNMVELAESKAESSVGHAESEDGDRIDDIETREGARPEPFITENEVNLDLINAAKNNKIDEVKRLLEAKVVDIDARDEAFYGQTAISWAAELGHCDVFKALYTHDARLDILDFDGNSPIYWATEKGRKDVIEFFLANVKERDISHKYHNGRSLLFVAAVYGSVDDVKRFTKSEPDVRDDNMLTPLMVAAQMSRDVNVEALLTAGADPTLEDDEGCTAVYYAVWAESIKSAKLLLDKVGDNFDINGSRPSARPLIAAAKTGDVAMIQLLLECGAKPILPDEDKKVPLYWAAKNGRIQAIRDLIEALLKVRVDPYKLQLPSFPQGDRNLVAFVIAAADNDEEWQSFLKTEPGLPAGDSEKGTTALHLAATHGLEEKAIERMLSAGFEVDARDIDDMTPLMLASKFGHVAAVKTLLQHNANPKLSDTKWNQTPLMWAAEFKQDQVIESLCEKSDVNVRGWNGVEMMAIHFAARSGIVKSVKILLEHGAEIDAVDSKYGQSPLCWATEAGHLEVVKTLIRAGADLYLGDSNKREPVTFALDNKDIVQALIEEERDLGEPQASEPQASNPQASNPRAGEPTVKETPRVRMAELALWYDYAGNGGESEISTFILNNKAYLKAVDKEGRNFVSFAAEGGDLAEMERLLGIEGLDFNCSDRGGRTPLSWAAGAGEGPVVKLLVKRLGKQLVEKSSDKNNRTPIHWVAESGSSDTIDIIKCLLENGVPVDSKDKLGRTPLSLAAEKGYDDITKFLLTKGADENSQDQKKRTILSWAAGDGHVDCVRILLDAGVDPDSKDNSHRTPLSWAAGQGHNEVVKTLLARRDPKAKEGGVRVEVNSRDIKLQTPLWHAAMNRHLLVVETLLSSRADPATTDGEGKNLIQVLADQIQKKGQSLDTPAMETPNLKAILEKLESSVSLWRTAAVDPDTAAVDEAFRATLLYIQDDGEPKLELGMNIRTLLNGDFPRSKQGKKETCTWVHLPANNMRWVEVLMAKRYKACGESERWKLNVVLKPRFWEQQQHKSQSRSYHARSMRPVCHRFDIGERADTLTEPQEANAKESKQKREEKTSKSMKLEQTGQQTNESGKSPPKQGESKGERQGLNDGKLGRGAQVENKAEVPQERPKSIFRGFVLFMPYLHWELEAQQNKLKKIMDEKKAFRRDEAGKKAHQDRIKEQLGKKSDGGPEDICGTEKLYWRYLDEEHPLHIRRTLDQFYYHTLANTDKRDIDQTVTRYYKNRMTDLKKQRLEPVITVVDQLWMWVLPACGEASETIITAFPQRSNRMLLNTSKVQTSLISNIVDRFTETPEKSVSDLAQAIAAECSRIYFDTMSNRNELTQFLEIYRTSIGELAEKETESFRDFQDNLGNTSAYPKNVAADDNADDDNEDPEVLKALLNIQQDIEHLRQIKDIRDELSIMLQIFHTQKQVMQRMEHILREPKEKQNGAMGGPRRAQTTLSPTATALCGIGGDHFEDRNDQRTFHLSPMLEVVNRNIEDLHRLETFAERTWKAVNNHIYPS